MLFILPFHPPKPPEAPPHNIYLPTHILLIFLKKKKLYKSLSTKAAYICMGVESSHGTWEIYQKSNS